MTDSISDPLHRLTHAYKSRLREIIQEQGIVLPVTHIRVLKGVCSNSQATAHSIAIRMRRDKAQITRVLKDLLADELITKVDHPKDGRSQLLKPTAQGRKLVRSVRILEARVMGQMTHNLDVEEIKHFVLMANKMADSLGHQISLKAGAE